MLFSQKISTWKKKRPSKWGRALWNPRRKEWRDIVESYIYISRKFRSNKLAIFKLQLWLYTDILNESYIIREIKSKIKELKSENILANGDNKNILANGDNKQFHFDIKSLENDIETSRLNIAAFREVADGIAWRYLNYNRAFLHILADKQSIDLLLPDKGAMYNLNEFSSVFLEKGSKAILNDITNFIRIADITKISENGDIEFIEVKGSKKIDRRVKRQVQRMQETVELFNSGNSVFDGKKLIISNSNVKQKNYLNQLKDSINRARARGYDSILVGEYLIVEIVAFGKELDFDRITGYFESKHQRIKNRWEEDKDFIYADNFLHKFEFVKSYAPVTVFPFSDEICADILMGKLLIKYFINFSEIIRILEKAGWKIVWNIFNEKQAVIEKTEWDDIYFYKVHKNGLTIPIPAFWIGRLMFEMLSPSAIIGELERIYKMGAESHKKYFIANYIDDCNIWD